MSLILISDQHLFAGFRSWLDKMPEAIVHKAGNYLFIDARFFTCLQLNLFHFFDFHRLEANGSKLATLQIIFEFSNRLDVFIRAIVPEAFRITLILLLLDLLLPSEVAFQLLFVDLFEITFWLKNLLEEVGAQALKNLSNILMNILLDDFECNMDFFLVFNWEQVVFSGMV